jgi:short-subunit dehydrogenase
MNKNFLQQYGPYALVTGASSGIGEQFARRLAAKGFNLLITARNQAALEALAQELMADGNITVQVCACDLSRTEDTLSLIQQAQQLPLGLIVSTAGFGQKGEFIDLDHQQLLDMYQTNCINPSRLVHALAPKLVQQGRGGIIFTGSMEGETPFPFSTAYAASKGFIHQFAGSLHGEMQAHGVDVLLLAPGSTDTNSPISQGFSREQLPGLMSPQTVAHQALQKLGKRSLWITGWHNRLFVRLLRVLPRSWAIKSAGLGMKSAIDKSKAA